MKLLHNYKNGNYTVNIFSDGTKIRETDDSSFIPEFSENIDIKITNYCDAGCQWCHENSTVLGKHASLTKGYINTLHPGTELAIGGGNPLSHPDLIEFLLKLKDIGVISNITVNQFHFHQKKYRDILDTIVNSGLVYGVGLSMLSPTKEFISSAKEYDNAVIHTINGVTTYSDFEKMFDNNLKILILGYKEFRRGEDYKFLKNDIVEKNKKDVYNNLFKISNHFKVLSFDNLALEQLDVKRIMSDKLWNEFYMGDDGGYTFYIDMVEEKFAKNSTSEERYDIIPGMTIKDMFSYLNKKKTID